MDQFRAVAERDPKPVAAQTMLGMLDQAKGLGSDAEKQYQKVLSIDPAAVVAANNWRGSTSRAIATSRKHCNWRRRPAGCSGHAAGERHARLDLLQAESVRKRDRHLELSIEKDATDPTVHYHLGMVYVHAASSTRRENRYRRRCR